MIQNKRQTFPFSRPPRDPKLRFERTELENVTRFLQGELDVLRNEINLAPNTVEQDDMFNTALLVRMSAAEARLTALETNLSSLDFQAQDDDLDSISDLTSIGFASRIAGSTWETRTLIETTNQVLIANADGVAGDPVFSLPQNIHAGATPEFEGLLLNAGPYPASTIETPNGFYLDSTGQPLRLDADIIAMVAFTALVLESTSALHIEAGGLVEIFSTTDSLVLGATVQTYVGSDEIVLEASTLLSLGVAAGPVIQVSATDIIIDAFDGMLVCTSGVVSAEPFESGTFTPTISFATPGDISVSYADQSAVYSRIGNVVSFSLRLLFTPTYTTAAGNIHINGLPFEVAAGPNQYLIAVPASTITWPTSTTQVVGLAVAGTTRAQMQSIGSGVAGASAWTTAHFPSATQRDIRISGFYIAT